MSEPLETENVKPKEIKSLLKKKGVIKLIKRSVSWHEDVVFHVAKDKEEDVESFRD